MNTVSQKSEDRIVHVPRRFVGHEWGGTETVIVESARQQQSMGWDPRVLTSMALANSREDEIRQLPVRRFQHQYPFFGLNDGERAAMDKKGGNLWSTGLFKALLTEPKVRLFHAHALKRVGGMVRTAARLRRKPFVVSLHGGVFDVPQDELRDLTEPIQGKVEWGRALGAVLGSRRVLDDADHVICVGQQEAEEARGRLGHDRISYLPNGVDCDRFTSGCGRRFRESLGLGQDAFVILCVSRIDSQKNQVVLVESFARLHRKNPNARLVLVGPETQPRYGGRLRHLIGEHGLEEVVRIVPGMDNDGTGLVDAYDGADVFVLPSRHEPFGIVVLEAWCAGKPVVVSRVGGLRALVEDEKDGLFFNPGGDGVEELTEQLQRLQESPALRLQLGQAGRVKARSQYDWSQISKRLEGIYQMAEVHAKGRKGLRS